MNHPTRLSVYQTCRYSLPSAFPSALTLLLVLAAAGGACRAAAQTNSWVSFGSNGQLVYGTTAKGDQIMDFSSAGYGAGQLIIPVIPMASGESAPLTPSGGDDTATIQAEINRVGALTAGSNGFKGAVVLGPGTFKISSSLKISTSGVVLRGSGTGTILSIDTSQTEQVTTTPCGPAGTKPVTSTVTVSYPGINISGSDNLALTGTPANLTDSYAPSGASTYNVYPHNLFTVGEQVVVRRPVTEAWKTALGMQVFDDAYSCQYDPASRTTWLNTPLPATSTLNADTATDEGQFQRTVVAQTEYTVTLDSPIPDSFDNTNYQIVGVIQPYTYSGLIQNVGVEDLEIAVLSGYEPGETSASSQPFGAITMNSLRNSWVRNVTALNTFNDFSLGKRVSQVTFDHVSVEQNTAQPSGAEFDHFGIGEYCERILISNSTIGGTESYNSFFVETAGLASGPNVVLNSQFTGTGDLGGHQRWATGMLADNVTLSTITTSETSNQVSFSARNAGSEGIAHGWTSAWNVVWNSIAYPPVTSAKGVTPITYATPAHEFWIEAPAGATNWCIGCTGQELVSTQPDQPYNGGTGTIATPPVGTDDVHSTNLAAPALTHPQSLYIAQLLQSIGTFQIVNANSGLALTDHSGAEVQEPYTAATDQQWTFLPVPGTPDAYTVVNVASGQLLNLTTGAFGTQATTIACGGGSQPACTTNQQFTVTPAFELYSLRFSEPLVISGDSTKAGTAVIEEEQGRQPVSQQWYLGAK